MKWNYRLSLVPNDTCVDSKLCGKFNQANKEFSPSLMDFIALILPYICPGWIFYFLIQSAKIDLNLLGTFVSWSNILHVRLFFLCLTYSLYSILDYQNILACFGFCWVHILGTGLSGSWVLQWRAVSITLWNSGIFLSHPPLSLILWYSPDSFLPSFSNSKQRLFSVFLCERNENISILWIVSNPNSFINI